MKYTLDAHEWFDLKKGFRWACCDCHLVHDVEARKKKDGAVEIRIFRNERSTQNMRRKHRKQMIIVDEKM